MNVPNDKANLRSSFRLLRHNFVSRHANRLEQEYAKLAKLAPGLVSLYVQKQNVRGNGTKVGETPALIVASFKALNTEIDPKCLDQALLALGHQVVWPRVEGQRLRFYSNDASPPFVRGSFGLWEPGPNATEAIPNLVLVPLLGFDGRGQRLGQGAGYYDRALASLGANVLALGVAWDCQQMEAIPLEDHYIALTGVITPSQFHLF